MKAVFHSSSERILIWWYPLHKSILENTSAHAKQLSMSSSLGIGKRYLIVILLIALLSIHILQEPSFLGVKRAGIAQGLILAQMYPLSRNSWTYFCNSSFSFGALQYAALFGRGAPGTKSRLHSTTEIWRLHKKLKKAWTTTDLWQIDPRDNFPLPPICMDGFARSFSLSLSLFGTLVIQVFLSHSRGFRFW